MIMAKSYRNAPHHARLQVIDSASAGYFNASNSLLKSSLNQDQVFVVVDGEPPDVFDLDGDLSFADGFTVDRDSDASA